MLLRGPEVEQVGLTQVSDEPVSSWMDTGCGGVPMETVWSDILLIQTKH